MKKVALTYIGGSSPGIKPIALSILSAVLKQKGHGVVLFDTTYMDLGFMLDGEVADKLVLFEPVDWSKYGLIRDKNLEVKKEFLKFLDREKPDIIAATAISDMYNHTIKLLRLVKEKYNIPVIIGGVHATILPEEVIQEDCIDALCIGEGEEALVEFVDSLEGNRITRTDIKNLWIKKDGIVHKNPLRELIDLNSLPFFDYSIYDDRQFCRPFRGRILRSGDYQDRRGCPRKCTYCAYCTINTKIYPRGRVKYYSVERFVEEAKYLAKTYHLEFFKFFSEDIFLRPEEELARMSELYAKEVGKPFTTTAYPLSVTKKKAELLKKMNCDSISVALDSGNKDYREHMLGRKYTNEQFARSIRILKDAGIRSVGMSMIGLPRESRKMIFETFEALRKTKPDSIDVGCYFPFRGTPLGDLAVRDRFVTPEEIMKSRCEHSRSILHMPQIDNEEINGIIKMHRFYLLYPKIFWPIFRLCEKESFWRNCLYSFIRGIDRFLYRIKKTFKR